MSTLELPEKPNLEHLRNQARTLLRAGLSSDPSAAMRFAACGVTTTPKLADALHVIAREYGFPTWPALKLHVDVVSGDAAEALSAGITANQAPVVREILSRHPSLKARIDEPLPNYSFDMPAIVAAAQKGNREIVDALLDFGANINARSRWWAGGFGVLELAPPEFSDYLISRGATVDIHAAARLGRIDRVRELLASNPELVHSRGGDGQLPLHYAATVEIASLLLDHGAEIDARDIDHESTAAQYMADSRQDVARFLISRGARTDLVMASALGDLSLVERILNEDPETVRITIGERNFPKRDPKSGGIIYIFTFGLTKSPHMIALQFGHTAVFELLMQRSAPWLRLVNAAEAGDEVLARELIERHPTLITRLSPNAARRIIGCAARNNTRAIELLLSNGWPANPRLDNGQTALHYAAFHGNPSMLRMLLEHNAPVNVFESEHGGSPLAWALYGSRHGSHRNTGDYAGVTRALLDAGAQIPKSEQPLEASDEVMAILEQHASGPDR